MKRYRTVLVNGERQQREYNGPPKKSPSAFIGNNPLAKDKEKVEVEEVVEEVPEVKPSGKKHTKNRSGVSSKKVAKETSFEEEAL
jgi:hypothetical protein